MKEARKVFSGGALIAMRHALAEAIASVAAWQEDHPLEDRSETTRMLKVWNREGRRIDRLLAHGNWRNKQNARPAVGHEPATERRGVERNLLRPSAAGPVPR